MFKNLAAIFNGRQAHPLSLCSVPVHLLKQEKHFRVSPDPLAISFFLYFITKHYKNSE